MRKSLLLALVLSGLSGQAAHAQEAARVVGDVGDFEKFVGTYSISIDDRTTPAIIRQVWIGPDLTMTVKSDADSYLNNDIEEVVFANEGLCFELYDDITAEICVAKASDDEPPTIFFGDVNDMARPVPAIISVARMLRHTCLPEADTEDAAIEACAEELECDAVVELAPVCVQDRTGWNCICR